MSTPTLSIVHGTTDKPVATDALIDALRDQDFDGQLLIGYPVIASPDGRYAIDALLVSPDHGLVCFDLVEGTELGNHVARQDEAYDTACMHASCHIKGSCDVETSLPASRR